MRHRTAVRFIVIAELTLLIGFVSCSSRNSRTSGLPGGDSWPQTAASEPRVFAPGVISHGFHELGLTMSPDTSQLLYVMANSKNPHYVIVEIHRRNGIWSQPEVASFSGLYSDYRPFYSPDGQSLYFSSVRPMADSLSERPDHDIWMVSHLDDQWGPPIRLGPQINTDQAEINPCVVSNGSLYFQTRRDDRQGFDLYYALREADSFHTAKRLPDGINTEHAEGGPFVAPDESYLIFHSSRPGGLGKSDLYISFRREDNSWSEPENLGAPINSDESETIPYVDPSGENLFFTSFRSENPTQFRGKNYEQLISLYRDPQNGSGTLYWVKADFIKHLQR